MKLGLSAVTLVFGLFWSSVVWAQTVFVQIEAHPNLATAQASAANYGAQLSEVNGFRFTTGWYVIALGPYNLNTAVSRLNTLKAQGAIPSDSYLVDRNAYSQQFYPAGADSLSAPAITGSAAPVQTPAATPEATPESTPETGQAAATPTTPEPVIVPEPPEETRREALRSESTLNRQEKFNLQIALKWFGFYDGAIDAAFGPGTRNSMAAWQSDMGYEPTGVLTTRQRAQLTESYEQVLASIGLTPITDARAGIQLEIPGAMVGFDRYEPPFAHYTPTTSDGVRVLLISQAGDENTLLGLYDIMQTLKIVPLEGERQRRSNQFTLTGENSTIKSYTYAVLDEGTIKGFSLIWPAGDDRRFDVALRGMRESFSLVPGAVLPDTLGSGQLEQSLDLVSGLEIRRPEASQSGFFVDAGGMVLTSNQGLDSCGRISLDETYDATVVATDNALGLALLKPTQSLAPLDFARLQPAIPRLKSEIAVSGYSFQGLLGAPTLTFGTIEDVKGLAGEPTLKRLALNTSPGDVGGPVFDASGAVFGLLLPDQDPTGKRLPDGVSFATDSLAIAEFLSNNGLAPAASDRIAAMPPETLTVQAANVTVLVSCWNE